MKNKSKLEMFVSPTNCGSGPCPTIYKSDDGRFFVQGYLVPDNIKGQINLPETETIVEVNPELLQELVKKM